MKVKTPKSELKKALLVVTELQRAVDLIGEWCAGHHKKFDYDTEIPYGIGVDLHVLPVYTLIERFFPELARDDWVKNHFSILKNVGDIVDLMRVVLNESRDPSSVLNESDGKK